MAQLQQTREHSVAEVPALNVGHVAAEKQRAAAAVVGAKATAGAGAGKCVAISKEHLDGLHIRGWEVPLIT